MCVCVADREESWDNFKRFISLPTEIIWAWLQLQQPKFTLGVVKSLEFMSKTSARLSHVLLYIGGGCAHVSISSNCCWNNIVFVSVSCTRSSLRAQVPRTYNASRFAKAE